MMGRVVPLETVVAAIAIEVVVLVSSSKDDECGRCVVRGRLHLVNELSG